MSGETLLDEDFEDGSVGSVPGGWDTAGNDVQRVTDATAGEGTRSFELAGSHGGCWEAIAHHELPIPRNETLTIRGLYRPGDGRVGCHSDKMGRLLLRTETGGTYPGDAVWLLNFRPDGTVRALGESLGEFDTDGWNSFEVVYDRSLDEGTVTLDYVINGRERLTRTREERSFEDDLAYLSLQSGDFTTYWDGLYAETGSGQRETTTRTTTSETTPAETILDEQFEDESVGSVPGGWDTAGNHDQQVTDVTAGRDSNSYRLSGSHGGCVEAIAHRELAVPDEGRMVLSGLYRTGDGAVGCHTDKMGRLLLRTETGGTYPGDGIRLLTFRPDGTVAALGENLGSFRTDDWNSFEVVYDRRPSEGTVSFQYTVNGRERLTKTREERPFEDDLAYLSLQSGDFTTYWDGLHAMVSEQSEYTTTSSPTPTTTATTRTPTTSTTTRTTTTRSPSTTTTSTTTPPSTETTTSPATTVADVDYDIESAGTYRVVTVGDRQYRVVWDIPDADSTRRAVVTPSGELVSPEAALDALITDAWAGDAPAIDWQAALQDARDDKRGWMILEDLNRVADLSVEVAAAIGLTSLGPAAAIGVASRALSSSIAWAEHEINDPYKEQFSKMSEVGGTVEWADQLVDGAVSATKFGEKTLDFITLGVDAYSAVGDVADVAKAYSATVQVARSTGSVKLGLMAGGNMAKAVAPQMFLSIAANYAVAASTAPFEANARTAALGAAHSTVRIPLIKEILKMRDAARSGTLSPAGIVRYKTYQMANFQIAAAATDGIAKYQADIGNSFFGKGFSVLFNSGEIARVARQQADRYDKLAKYAVVELGAGWSEALYRRERSINAEVSGDGGENR